ncbi:MAG: ParB/RepB/Spo0J family partition protein [Candidatus Erginobacter occultus]|nr:ParB/RepB/Spo0J family partition protein [Candidatus Erginobacter occultus]
MATLKNIELDAITISKDHIRVQSLDPKALEKLSASILSYGLLVRIIVRPVGEGRYELVDGERRYFAFRSLYEKEGRKWIAIPAIVEEMTPQESVRRQVAINENRQDLTPFEKAKGYKLAWETGYFQSYRELASLVGKSHTTISRSIGIFKKFPPAIIAGFEKGSIKQAYLESFYRLPDRKAMLALYRAIIREDLKSAQVRERANRLDEKWLSGDRELLIELAGKDPRIKELLGSEIKISDLVNKSKLTVVYTNLTRARELVNLLHVLMESGAYRTTLTQYHKNQGDATAPRPKSA